MRSGSITISLLLVGCAAPDGDGRDDSFTEPGKLDTGGVEDGGKAARGVLRVANESSRALLEDEVGLSADAAKGIVAYRLGDDEQSGTVDDEVFDTLAELDAVPFVGPVAFSKLLAYATAQGYLDPACGDGFAERGELCYSPVVRPLRFPLEKPVLGAIADANLDGNLDVLVSMAGARFYFYAGDGRGGLADPRISPASGTLGAFTVGDVTRDGRPDLVAVVGTPALGYKIEIYRGDGTGAFALRDSYLGSGEPVLGDFDRDGDPDLAVVGQTPQGAMVQVRLNDGTGRFGPQTTYTTAPCGFPGSPRVLDVDADGSLDVYYACFSRSHVGVLRGLGDGTFQREAIAHELPGTPGEVTLADFNGDGVLDLAANMYYSNALVVRRGTSPGAFDPMNYFFQTSAVSRGPVAVVAADLDADQVLDLATVSDSSSQPLDLMRGDGRGLFFDPVPLLVNSGGAAPRSLHAGDLNGDGRLDFLVLHPGEFGGRGSVVLSSP